MLFLKRPLILLFLCHKLTITTQIDSNKVSNAKLKLDAMQLVKSQHNWIHSSSTVATQMGHNFLGHPKLEIIYTHTKFSVFCIVLLEDEVCCS